MTPPDWFARLPKSLPAIACLLVLLSWIGISRAEEFIEVDGRYSRQQLVWAALGLAVFVAVSLPNYRLLARWSYVALAVSLVSLLAVYAFPAVNGAHRWIRLGPIGVQPSEFAKLAFIAALAQYLMYRENYRRLLGLLVPLGMAFLPVLLILKEPDLGTALVFLPVLFAMLLAAGARTSDLAKLVVVGCAALPVLWSQMSREQQSRVAALFSQAAAGDRPGDDGYQLYQSKQMLALGKTWGSAWAGDTVDDLSVYHLPEAHTDFIFSVLGERLGLLGPAAVLLLYATLAWRGLRIADNTREPFGRLLAVGISALFAVEVLINTGMTVGLLPVTGLSLPLVSYGGSGMLAHCLALGLLANVGLRPGYELAKEPFRWSEA